MTFVLSLEATLKGWQVLMPPSRLSLPLWGLFPLCCIALVQGNTTVSKSHYFFFNVSSACVHSLALLLLMVSLSTWHLQFTGKYLPGALVLPHNNEIRVSIGTQARLRFLKLFLGALW